MSDTRISLPFHVLFVDDTNGAASLMSEALLRDLNATVGNNRFVAHSAGLSPDAQVHADVLAELRRRSVPVDALKTKTVDQAIAAAARIDLVVSHSDATDGAVMPPAGGVGVQAYWPVEDPLSVAVNTVDATQRARAMSDVFEICRARVDRLARLPTASLEERQAVLAIANSAKPEIHPEDYPAEYGVTLRPDLPE